ncbi:transglycosylase domain-containing protein [Fervidobacterium thailandense]|uniref:transglycosylase domain-containing protein n=2 Tax=Fervidobacterium thailandense TaxID=1008305 RepID=UPI00355C4468
MKFFISSVLIISIIVFLATYNLPLLLYNRITSELEAPENKVPTGLIIEYSDGTLLYSPKTVWRDYDEIPQILKDSVIASEDRRFYRHSGVDLKGILRSLFVIITTDEIQGGSTITQQLARTLYLTTERTWRRKLKEIMIALWLEQKYSKEEILEMYINSVYLGNGIYGFPAAARYYFKKSLDDLNPLEIAMLVATLRSPERANPLKELNAQFTKIVLNKMKEADIITEEEFQKYLQFLGKERIYAYEEAKEHLDVDLFWMIVTDLKDLGFDLALLRNGFRVRTTLDRNMQRLLMENIDKKNMAGLILEHTTGRIKAAYGLGIFEGRRQIGSVVKPYYYYLAFMAGWNKSDILEDKPIRIGKWEPKNFDEQFWQRVTLENALVYSRNVPSVNLFMKLGQNKVKHFIQNVLMVGGYFPNDATISLGTIETSLVDVAKGYEPIFNGGIVVRPRIIEYVRDKNGVYYYSYRPEVLNIVNNPKGFDARTPIEASILMLQVMEKVVTMGTGKSAFLPGRTIYGKTGTAEKNAWFVGGDGKYLFLLVKDGKNLTGGRDVAPIWKKIASQTTIGYTPISLPLKSTIAKTSPSGTESSELEGEKIELPSPQAPSKEETTSEVGKVPSISELYERVKNRTITAMEILDILKTKSPDEQREILTEINKFDPDLAAEVYLKLLGGGEF